MPIRRLNFTKRRRVTRDEVDIVLHEDASPPTFDAQLQLGRHDFPADARVIVEAYRQTSLVRFDFGTVDALRQPADTSLGAFESPAAIKFRVRVTSVSGRPGLLLGLADQIRPRSLGEKPDKRLSLLPVKPDDLGQELWRVEFGGDATFLVVNDKLPNWKETSRDPWFRAAVFPAAMRCILERILYVEKQSSTDGDDWPSQWLRFASALPGSASVPKDRGDYDDWIEDATAAFARRTRLRSSYEASTGDE